ncbi:MAG TPA: bifunctional oligoribonuclease/PAP phosphatase NrnA [Bacilli bacterium]|nr:bifunctional oligoribonuclease/PAP phosphatase NrnA [Bacilli bacterium]
MKLFSPSLNRKISEYEEFINQFAEKINEYDQIGIFAHKTPDPDALGSEFGMYFWLKDNFPNKDIKVFGEDHQFYSNNLYPLLDKESDEWFDKPFLALILDLGNMGRCSEPRAKKAAYTVKIDHHPNVEPYGQLMLVDPMSVAVSEILSIIFLALSDKYTFAKKSATMLYSGIVGDSGRFRYATTSAATFAVAEQILEIGVDINKDVYAFLYTGDLEDLYTKKYILSQFKVTSNGFVYYVLDAEAQKRLNITPERGKENVNIFAGIKGIKAWAAITEDIEEGRWRVSLRSAGTPINELAAKWNGGGHPQASGASLFNRDEIEVFVNEVNEYLKD